MPSTRTSHGAGLLTLLQLSDSALPTGSFSHSFGLETYLDRGIVTGEEDFVPWLDGYLAQMAYADALALRLATEAQDLAAVRRVDSLMHAAAVPQQIREAGVSMGARMSRIAGLAVPGDERLDAYLEAVADGDCHGHPAIVFALAARAVGIPAEDAVAAYLMSLTTSLVQNAIRAVPLGQDAGQRILSGAHGQIGRTVSMVGGLGEEDLGAAAPGLEIAQMVHENQRARMFMS